MKVTINDIAKQCGVGKATVSRAVNNSGSVKKEVREKILKYVTEIGWQASAAAASLTTGKSYTVGIIVNNISYYLNHTMLEKINQKLLNAGYQNMLSIRHCSDEVAQYQHRQVDAMIIFSPRPEMKEEIAKLRKQGIRVVTIGPGVDDDTPSIVSDKVSAGHQAMDMCAKSGCDRVLFIGAPENFTGISEVDKIPSISNRELLRGIRASAQEHNIDFRIPNDCMGEPTEEQLHEKLAAGKYNGCICFTVPDLIKFYSCCRELGLKIPADISVIAVEADDFFHALTPEPTHFIHDYDLFADAVISNLLNADSDAGHDTIIPYIFVEGKSMKY